MHFSSEQAEHFSYCPTWFIEAHIIPVAHLYGMAATTTTPLHGWLQDAKLIRELSKDTPFFPFLAQKAVEVMDDMYYATKYKDLDPELFHVDMKQQQQPPGESVGRCY